MELRDYVRVLRKSWALILAVTIVGIALGVGLTLLTTKVYQASTQVFVSSNATDTSTVTAQTSTFIEARVASYPNLATSPAVLAQVLDDATVKAALAKSHRTLSEQQLAAKVSADAPQNMVIINIHVTDTDPSLATLLANVVTKNFDAQVMNKFEQKITVVNGKKTKEIPAVQLTTSKNAVVPSAPVKPNKVLNIGLGLVVGLMIGVAVAVVREVLDNTVKSAQDFEEMGVPLLAMVAFDKRAARSPIAFRGDAHSARSEAYRTLRTNLQFVDVDNPPRIIAVTSAVPGEGKTSTAINLAASLAEAGGRVCLIEADLRRPSMASSLGLVGEAGFTTVVIGKAPVETVLQNAGKNLAVLTCGPIPPNPSELLISKHAKQVIADIAAKVDFVIIDTPPLLPVTDGAEIATIADATILVHRAAKTTRDQAARSIEALEKVGRRPVGVVLNMVTRSGGGRYDYEYGYYYSAYRPKAGAKTTADAEAEAQAESDAVATRAAATVTAPASAPPSAEPAPADAPKGRRARHRGRRAAEQASAAAAARAADTADTSAFTPVAQTAAAQEPVSGEPVPGEPVPGETEPAESEDVPAESEVAEPAAAEKTGPVAVTAAPDEDEFADEFDDEYDLYLDEPLEAGRTAADDDTAEMGAVQIDGQEELPLNERINGRSDSAEDHSLDEPLGARGERR